LVKTKKHKKFLKDPIYLAAADLILRQDFATCDKSCCIAKEAICAKCGLKVTLSFWRRICGERKYFLFLPRGVERKKEIMMEQKRGDL